MLQLRNYLLNDKFQLNILELVEIVHHTYMLDQHSLGAAKQVADIVADAWCKIGNMQIDGNHDGCDTLNKHIVMIALKYVSDIANHSEISNQALIEKVLNLLAGEDAETGLADIAWGTNCWYAKYRQMFFQEIAKQVVKVYPPRYFTTEEEHKAESISGCL